MKVSGVLLAAGVSERFGGRRPKPLLLVEGEPLIRRIARRALQSRLTELVVVLGHEHGRIRETLSDLDLKVIRNPTYRRGQSSSVKAGLGAIDEGAGAALFIPVDQPFLTTALLNRLIQAHREKAGSIVLPAFGKRPGSPVLFDRAFFAELAALTGDQGGRQILARHRGSIITIKLKSERALLDIDTPEDYRRLVQRRHPDVDT